MVAIEPGEADLTALARGTVAQLAQVLGPRMAGIELKATLIFEGVTLKMLLMPRMRWLRNDLITSLYIQSYLLLF